MSSTIISLREPLPSHYHTINQYSWSSSSQSHDQVTSFIPSTNTGENPSQSQKDEWVSTVRRPAGFDRRRAADFLLFPFRKLSNAVLASWKRTMIIGILHCIGKSLTANELYWRSSMGQEIASSRRLGGGQMIIGGDCCWQMTTGHRKSGSCQSTRAKCVSWNRLWQEDGGGGCYRHWRNGG